MIQSAPAPLRDSTGSSATALASRPFPSVPVAIQGGHINAAQRPRDRSGSDLSASLVSNDSSIFDTISMSDVASIASSVPSDTEDNLHEADFKYHPPRISSKTYMQQHPTPEIIQEDPDEDSENGDQVLANAIHPGVQVTHPSPRSTAPAFPPPLHITTSNLGRNGEIKDDSPIEMKHHKHKLTRTSDTVDAVNGKNTSASKSSQSATSAVTPGTPKASDTQPPPGDTPLTSAKKEKSGFFHRSKPMLNRPKSQTLLQGDAKIHHLKDSIINVFSSANNSAVKSNKTPPESKGPSTPGTPNLLSTAPSRKSSVEPTPQTSAQASPTQQFSSPPPVGPGPRRVASVGPNMMLARGPILKHDDAHLPVTGVGHKAQAQTRPTRAISDPPAAAGVRRAKTLKECGVTNRGKVAGKGATATVTRAECKGKLVALKTFQKGKTNESDAEFKRRIDVEFEIAHSLHHPNVVETMELVWDEGKHNWAETMEWCGGGDLYSIIKNGTMTPLEKNCCFKQLVRGVAYMHSQGIVHRDIKPENLLLNEEGQLKITDFGVSDVVFHDGEEHNPKRFSGLCGSEPYMAPEVHTSEEYHGFPLDVWGCGIVYISLTFSAILWSKAAVGDKGYETYLASYLKAQERTAKKIEEAKHQQHLDIHKHGNEDARSTTSSTDHDHDHDRKSVKSEDNDALSRISSSMSFKSPSPTGTPPNDYTVPGSPTRSENRPDSSEGLCKTPKRAKSFGHPPTIKPDAILPSPLPIAKAASAAKGEVKAASPQYIPFERFQPHQRRLLYRILDPNPATRITAAEILKDPWFKEIQCCSFDPDELFRVQSGTFDASKGTVNKKKAMPVKHKHSNHLIKPVKK